MKKKKIWIDCDPGHDDAIAILWALADDNLEVLGISTVAGNQTIEKVTKNACKVLTIADKEDVIVCKGAEKPLMQSLQIGGQVVHGESGLEGPILPESKIKVDERTPLELISKILKESGEDITLVGLGPLTNIAQLLIVYPDLKEKIREIVIMGGGTIGNWTAAAEYNIFADPEAAHIVFSSGIKVVMAGLDVTQKAYVTKEENEILRSQGDSISKFTAELIDYFSKYHHEVEGFPGCTLHDPCAIAYLAKQDLFETIDCNVQIELSGTLTRGMTVVDKIDYQRKIFNKHVCHNTLFIEKVDREKFVKEFFSAMAKLGREVDEVK